MKLPEIKNVFNDLTLGRLANWLTAFISALLLLVNVRAVDMQKEPIDLQKYKLVFSDEFDGDTLNRNIWDVHNFEGVRKGGYWTMDQAFVRDGNLVIRTEYKEDGAFGRGWYTCGIATQHHFEHRYGYYECRCILPKGKGMWSAFWLMTPGVNNINGSGREGAELDIFESPYYFLPGKRSHLVTSNIHYDGYELQTKYKNVVISKLLDNDPYENYNTYGLLWTPDEYIFYVNGREVGRTDFGGASQVKEYMILSCEVDGTAAIPTFGWSGHIRQNGGKDFCAEFLVDYVRVYDPID